MKNLKKLLALLLAMVMVVGMFPMTAAAEDENTGHIETCLEGCTGENCECLCHQPAVVDDEPEDLCPTCGAENCTSEHTNWCAICKADNCGNTHVTCEKCGTVDCTADHTNWCAICKADNCGNTHVTCEKCGTVDCTADHTNWCDICKKDNCGVDHTPVQPETCESCGIELVEGAEHKYNCQTNCDCTPTDGVHANTCPTNCTCTPVEGVHNNGCVFAPVVEATGPQVGDKIWIKSGSKVYKKIGGNEAHPLSGNYEVKIKSIVDNEWYEFEFTSLGFGEVWLYISGYKYVKVENTSVEEPEESGNSTVEKEGIAITGVIPDDVELSISVVDETITNTLSAITDFGRNRNTAMSRTFYEIKANINGAEWQPNGKIKITFDNYCLDEDQVITVIHYLDNADAIRNAIEEEKAEYYTAAGLEEIMPNEAAALKAVDPEAENTVCYVVYSTADESVTVEDGKVSIMTDSFSIYQLQKDFSGDATLINDNDTITISTDDEIYLKWIDPDETGTANDLKYGVWAVTAGTDVIELTTYSQKEMEDEDNCSCTAGPVHKASCPAANNKGECNCDPVNILIHDSGCKYNDAQTYKYPYAKIMGLKPGKATLVFTYHTKSTTAYVNRACYNVNIVVNDEKAFRIEDQIASNGCLVPIANSSLKEQIKSYRWTKSNGTIDNEALTTYAVGGGVNVAIDKGGITNANKTETVYTVEGLDAEGNVVEGATDSFTVKYGNEVINGGFESPVIQSKFRQLPNGTPELYWLTTGLGKGEDPNTIDKLGHDIEIMSDVFGTLSATYSKVTEDQANTLGINPGINAARIGHQCAELNCEEYGALYQDVITTPGATLNWSVSHAARFPSCYTNNADGEQQILATEALKVDKAVHKYDHMCVIIMPTEYAKLIINKADVDYLLEEAGYRRTDATSTNPCTVETCNCGLFDGDTKISGIRGKYVSVADFKGTGKTVEFYIYDCQGEYDKWTDYSGSYIVPSNQYLTRFFFAAAVSVNNGLTLGNFIDKVSFGEKLSYRIEYYKQDTNNDQYVLIDNLTEVPDEAVDIDSTVMATKTNAEELSGYSLSMIELNGAAYNDTSFMVRPSNAGTEPVLKLYYVQKGIAVTKKIEGIDSSLTMQQMQTLLKDYEVTIDLFDNANCNGNKVATATLVFNDGVTSKVTMFKDATTGKQFAPEANTTYYVKETSCPSIYGYDAITNPNTSIWQLTTDNNGLGNVVVTNKYSQITEVDLTIKKKVSNPEQSFMFNIKNNSGYDMTVTIPADSFQNGESSVTIKNIPVGTYDVIELSDWSWRYNLNSVAAAIDTDAPEVKQNNKLIGRKVELLPTREYETVTFTNAKNDPFWLSGDCYAENWWGGENGTKVVERDAANSIVTRTN